MMQKQSQPIPPGLTVEYNHDLDVNADFTRQFQPVGKLLRQPVVLDLFYRYEREAKNYKRRFHLLGMLSLVSGTVALICVALELLVAGLGKHSPGLATVIIELVALASFCLLLIARVRCYRTRWRIACFARERIRQWHFQLFLDGELVEGLAKTPSTVIISGKPGAPNNATDELTRRWREFTENLKSGAGSLDDFLHDSAAPARMFHPVTPYRDPDIEGRVSCALATLRFNHQAQYSRRKIAHESPTAALSAREHHHWAESVASITLLLAVLAPAAQLVVLLAHSLRLIEDTKTWHTWLFAAALVLAVLSASVRAYRTGLTLPEEIESYEEYVTRVGELRELFLLPGGTMEHRSAVLKDLEIEAARELRRFLVLKGKATFIA